MNAGIAKCIYEKRLVVIMRIEVISEQQGVAVVSLFLIGTAILLGTGDAAGSDIWLAHIIAIGAAFPVLAIYARLHQLLPDRDYFDMLEYAFGKILGKLVGASYAWFAFHLGALVFRNFGEFMITVALEETPQLLPIGMFALVCLWAAKEGLEVLGRWSNLFLRYVVGLVVTTILLLLTEVEFTNLLPVMYDGFYPVGQGAFGLFTFPFAETVVFLLVFRSFQAKTSPFKVYLGALLFTGILLTVTSTVEMSVLGPELFQNSYFPAYEAVGRLNIREFIQRVEILAAISFLFGGFVKVSVCILGACRGVEKVFNFDDYHFIVTPITILMVVMSLLLYDGIVEMNHWALEVWPLYAFPFQAVIPVIVWLIIELKVRLYKDQPKAAQK